jgi:hypothetical protein
LIHQTDRAAFVVNPDYIRAFEAGESGAAGFPLEDVFEFDHELYRRLCEQWERARKTDDALWQVALPYTAQRAA